jgi:hypothetical protein
MLTGRWNFSSFTPEDDIRITFLRDVVGLLLDNMMLWASRPTLLPAMMGVRNL